MTPIPCARPSPPAASTWFSTTYTIGSAAPRRRRWKLLMPTQMEATVDCAGGGYGGRQRLSLAGEGHEVCVIDESPEALSLLGDDFAGQFVIGQAIDWTTLHAARLGDAKPHIS